MAITAVGTIASSSGTGTTNTATQTVATPVVGDLWIFGSSVLTSTITITGISGGGVPSSGPMAWQRLVGPFLSNGNHYQEMWMGQVTTASGTTITATYSSAINALNHTVGAQAFRPNINSPIWAPGQTGNTTSASATTITYPNLSPVGSLGELYIGKCYQGGTASAGSTSGFTYQLDADGCPFIYNVGVTGSVTPTQTETSNFYDTIAAMVSVGSMYPAKPARLRTRQLTAIQRSNLW